MALPRSHCLDTEVSLSYLIGAIKLEAEICVPTFIDQQKAEVVELNVQLDHMHLIAMVPPKISLPNFVDTVKGRTVIRVFNKFRSLKRASIGVIISGPMGTV